MMNTSLQDTIGADGRSIAGLPFDSKLLDTLLDGADIDVLLVTSKHNIQYLLGGYRFFFFDQFDALGITRYLPVLIYFKGRPERTVYVGNAMEDSEADNGRFWCQTVDAKCWGTLDATDLAVNHIKRMGPPKGGIGVETSFFPADAMEALRAGLPDCQIVNAHLPLERLRAVKTKEELALIRAASDRVVDAMLATFAEIRAGMTKHEVTARLRQEEVKRGLNFDYCLITAGTGANRAPSHKVIEAGDIISLDSGGTYGGYIGDLCRMGIVGTPDPELEDALGWVETIQQAARTPISQGVRGQMIFAAVADVLASSAHPASTHFVAHGMGLIGHEAPRLSDQGPVTYPAYDADRPLQAGMVLSIETTLMHPSRGFIKLEDTVVVTTTGWEAYGDTGRGWNRCPTTAA